MDILVGRKPSRDAYAQIPYTALTTRSIPRNTMRMLRFDTASIVFQGDLSVDDFKPDTDGNPFCFEPASAGVYQFDVFLGASGNTSADLDVTNSYDVSIVQDSNQQQDYLTIGQGFVGDMGGFCNVSACCYMGPGKESSVHIQIRLTRQSGLDGQIVLDKFLIRIVRVS